MHDKLKRAASHLRCLIGGLLFTPLAFVLAVLSAGAGHGNYAFARLFFPFSMLATRVTEDVITTPLILVALAQFPMYGILMDLGRVRGWSGRTAAVLACVHGIAAVLCFCGTIPNFS